MLHAAGDTHPTRTLNELAEGTDMLIQQIMGPLPAFDSLSFESQYLLNVSPAAMRRLARGLIQPLFLLLYRLHTCLALLLCACQDFSSEVRHAFHLMIQKTLQG